MLLRNETSTFNTIVVRLFVLFARIPGINFLCLLVFSSHVGGAKLSFWNYPQLIFNFIKTFYLQYGKSVIVFERKNIFSQASE